MFTGLVQESAPVVSLEKAPSKLVITLLSALPQAPQFALGASISVNGVCLTVVANEAIDGQRKLRFDVSPETLSRSNLGELKPGGRVHLEAALRMGDPLGGHLVSGHIDGVGVVRTIRNIEEFKKLEFETSGDTRAKVAPYLVDKGSVAVDGVSLTVNAVRDEGTKTFFDVMLVPHTLQVTRFDQLRVGDTVNLEADMVAKYVSRNLEFGGKHHG